MCLDWETEAENRTASRAAKGAKYLKCRLRQLLLILEMDMTLIFPLNYSHWCVMRQIKSTFVYFSWLGEWGFNFFLFLFSFRELFMVSAEFWYKCSDRIWISIFFFLNSMRSLKGRVFHFCEVHTSLWLFALLCRSSHATVCAYQPDKPSSSCMQSSAFSFSPCGIKYLELLRSDVF